MTSSPERSRAAFSWLASLLAAFVMGVGFMLPPEDMPHITMCWFYAMTGLPCPACGLTRSFSAILHGDLARAWRMNPFGYLAFAIALFFLLCPLLKRFFPRLEEYLGKPRVRSSFLWILLCAFLLFGLLRLYVTWHPDLAEALHVDVWNPR